ncbi:TonB C-terminal domain-containing protein [Massilia sp. 9I]|uniref:TonB C-terminal domain-containing protein n=1 Tax=Massilia sp. 9I TaxID=2653152 RepID=UPI00135A0ECD|nr:TonB C-terminal domain-containing protein [Massilia sp. 9I]
MLDPVLLPQAESNAALPEDGRTATPLMQPAFPWRMRIAVLVSLLVHALFLSLSVGGDAFGLPGLRFPWEERRLAAHDLRIVLAEAPPAVTPAPVADLPVAAPVPAPPPPKPSEQAAPPVVAVVKQAEAERPSAPVVVQAIPSKTDDAEQKRSDNETRERALAQAKLEREKQEAEQRQTEVIALAKQEAARVEAARLEAARNEQARLAQLEAQRQEQAKLAEQARQESIRERERAEAARLEAAKQEQARQEQARQEQARQDQVRQEQARQEQVRQEQARKEQARQEQARQEQARQEQARQEQARQEQARQEQARQEQARQEQARQEQARQEQARQEQARQEQARQDAAKREQAQKDQAQRERAEQEAKREERLRAIGRQLDQEAAQRQPTASGLRRGWLFGRADPNVELVQYAQAMGRKIELNMTFDMVRELVKQPHVRPVVTVAVRADGSVEKVTFVTSSGVPVLDEAVRKVIASQAPYGPFPPALARQYDVVEIRRTWIFDTAIRLE